MKAIQFADGEKIVYKVRRHWLAFAVEIIFLIGGGVLPYVISLFQDYFASYKFMTFYFQPHIFLLSYGLWLEFLLILLFIALTDHYLDVWVITDSRVIDIEQKGTFSREISSLRYENVGEVTVVKGSGLDRVFGFGTVVIKKTGSSDALNGVVKDEFRLADIRRPQKISEMILSEQRKSLERLAGALRSKGILSEQSPSAPLVSAEPASIETPKTDSL